VNIPLSAAIALMASPLLPSAPAAVLPAAAPGQVGISAERLERMHALIQGYVDRTKIAGAITLVARDGRIVDLRAYGCRDLEAKLPMQRDTMFRIASMTKLVTAVAVLSLFEEGRFGLDDPIGDYIPELKRMRVLAGGDPDHPKFAEARPITIRHLLTHTSGLTYGDAASPALQPYYSRLEAANPSSLQAFMVEVAKLPLNNQPGDAMHYGISYEVLGRLVEVVSGQPFDAFVHDRILAPLGMRDTYFQVPPVRPILITSAALASPAEAADSFRPRMISRPSDKCC